MCPSSTSCVCVCANMHGWQTGLSIWSATLNTDSSAPTEKHNQSTSVFNLLCPLLNHYLLHSTEQHENTFNHGEKLRETNGFTAYDPDKLIILASTQKYASNNWLEGRKAAKFHSYQIGVEPEIRFSLVKTETPTFKESYEGKQPFQSDHLRLRAFLCQTGTYQCAH